MGCADAHFMSFPLSEKCGRLGLCGLEDVIVREPVRSGDTRCHTPSNTISITESQQTFIETIICKLLNLYRSDAIPKSSKDSYLRAFCCYV